MFISIDHELITDNATDSFSKVELFPVTHVALAYPQGDAVVILGFPSGSSNHRRLSKEEAGRVTLRLLLYWG